MKSIGFYLWTSFAVGAVLSVIAQVHSEDRPSVTSVVTVMISRRLSLDIYTIHQGNNTYVFSCNPENSTYLVKENHSHYLFNGNLHEMNYY